MQPLGDESGGQLIKNFVQHAYIISFFVTLAISIEHAVVATFVFKNHSMQFNYLLSKCLNDSSTMIDLNISEPESYDASINAIENTVFTTAATSSLKECCNRTKQIYVLNAKILILLYFCSIMFLTIALIGYLNLCYDKIIQNGDTLSTKTEHLKYILKFNKRTTVGIILTFVLNFWILLYFKVKLESNLFKDIHCYF